MVTRQEIRLRCLCSLRRKRREVRPAAAARRSTEATEARPNLPEAMQDEEFVQDFRKVAMRVEGSRPGRAGKR